MKSPKPPALVLFIITGLLMVLPFGLQAQKSMTFRIKKDKHTSTNRCIRFVKGGQINFDIFVNPQWVYNENAPGFQSGWNKLIGISDGLNRHKNSVRIGWRSIGGKIFMCSYCYVNGERIISEMAEVPFGWNSGSVIITDSAYKVLINNQVLEVTKSGSSAFLLMMYPYFGGNSTAPHDMEFLFRINPW